MKPRSQQALALTAALVALRMVWPAPTHAQAAAAPAAPAAAGTATAAPAVAIAAAAAPLPATPATADAAAHAAAVGTPNALAMSGAYAGAMSDAGGKPAAVTTPGADAQTIARGLYLTRAADCIACHTTAQGKPFAGGLPFVTPVGTIYSPNITPDRATGIGAWTDAQFRRALHEGVRADGKHLYPAFPYTAYTKLSDADVQSIRAYLNTVPAVGYTPPKNDLIFPFSVRGMMVFWNTLFFKEGRQPVDAARGAVWNRGAYLSDALGHCAECHTPRNVFMALKNKPFAGGKLQGWHAYNVTPDADSGIGGWSEADIVTYLSTGKLDGKASAAGPMAEVVENSTQYLSRDDLQAMAVYLKALHPISQDDSRPRTQWGTPAQDVAAWRGAGAAGTGPYSASSARNANFTEAPSTSATSAGATPAINGAVLFNANCASCHSWNGNGVGAAKAGGYPALPHNSAAGAANADNLTMVILNGVSRRSAGAPAFMPAFRSELNDAEIAALSNYVSGQFGNPQARQSDAGVAKLRAAR